jgi:eukaryotic-like serine/threonine-protein kinase
MRLPDPTRWRAISSVLDELLDVDGTARRIRLAEICCKDRELGAELESLLASEGPTQQHAYLEGSVLPVETHGPGETVGSYTLASLIGRGGMGSVWLAHRSDGLFDGRAAIKFMHVPAIWQGGSHSFRREGSILASLDHPHIARLLDAGLCGQGQPYLVLEYVDGVPLDQWCNANAPTVEARVRIFSEVLCAVSHAHERQILHRDLKPSNILVTRDGRVKLLDFGIASLQTQPGPRLDARASAVCAAAVFTPEFAAPEQVLCGELSAATDVYALGVLLHVLLCGVHPTSRAGAALHERMRAIVENEPGPLWAAGATGFRYRHGDGDGLARIVAKALKKEPLARYANAGDMAADLARCAGRQYIDGHSISNAGHAGRPVRISRLRRRTWTTAALVALAFLAGLAVPSAAVPALRASSTAHAITGAS